MLDALKRVIRRAPRIDSMLTRVYYGARDMMERLIVGTRLQEFLWKRRHASTIIDPALI